MRFHSVLLSLFPLLASLHQVSAASDRLYTDSVSYCAQNNVVQFDQFSLSYWKANQSVSFYFNLASAETDLNTSLIVYLNIYGKQSVNQTVDLCSILYGVLCPLPQLNFTGSGSYEIPSSYTSGIPDLAWTVPNIEAYARVELVSSTTGEVAACLQATLSNGLTVQHEYVVLISALLTLVALLVGLFHSGTTTSPSPAQYRWFDILFLFQTAASTGLLHLNYPLVYSNFVQNFRWALGLFSSNNMQSSIDKMRDRTGGKLSGTAYNPVQNIDNQLSPYNLAAVVNVNRVTESASSFHTFLAASRISAKRSIRSSFGFVSRSIPTSTDEDSSSDLVTGIPAYTNTADIPQANAYDTIFFVFLAFIAIALAFHVILFAVVLIVDKIGRGRRGTMWAGRLRLGFWNFCMGNALRVCLIGFLPIWIFGFYQFTIGRSDSGLSIFFAVFGILLTLIPLLVVFVLSIFKHRKVSSTAPDISPLFTSWRWFHSAGAMYRPYRQRLHFTWFAPLVLAMIARAGFIAFGSARPYAQVIGCMVLEFIVLLYLLITRPHKDKKGDWLGVILSFLRLASFGLLIAFITEIGVGAITRAIIGFVLIALFGIPTVLLFLGLIWNAGYGYLWRRHRRRVEDGMEVDAVFDSDDDSKRPAMEERGVAGVVGMDSQRTSTIIPPGDGSAPTLDRRTSIMEPVGENIYPNHHYPSDYHSSIASYPPGNEVSSQEAYAAASRGPYNDKGAVGSNHYSAYGGPVSTEYPRHSNGQSVYGNASSAPDMMRNNTSSTRPASGYSEYYTPAGMIGGTGTPIGERGYSGHQYFDAQR